MATSFPSEPVVRKNNPLAFTAGILPIISIILVLIGVLVIFISPTVAIVVLGAACGIGFLMNLVALVLGIIGLVQLKNHHEQKGKGWAIFGIIMGGLSILTLCLSPVLGTAVLAMLGPIIGNTFDNINSALLMP